MSGEQMQLPDGRWVPAVPLGWQGSGPDFEVQRDPLHGVWEWTAWDEDMCVGRGTARTRIGLYLALRRAKRLPSPVGEQRKEGLGG